MRLGRRPGMGLAAVAGLALVLAACDGSTPLIKHDEKEDVGTFPDADRPVATIISSRWSTEEARDRLNEAADVMDKAGIAPGMTVADIGAGQGYSTVRPANRVGPEGRVLADDIAPHARDAPAARPPPSGPPHFRVPDGQPPPP